VLAGGSRQGADANSRPVGLQAELIAVLQPLPGQIDEPRPDPAPWNRGDLFASHEQGCAEVLHQSRPNTSRWC
jgi:hypothetical protein